MALQSWWPRYILQFKTILAIAVSYCCKRRRFRINLGLMESRHWCVVADAATARAWKCKKQFHLRILGDGSVLHVIWNLLPLCTFPLFFTQSARRQSRCESCWTKRRHCPPLRHHTWQHVVYAPFTTESGRSEPLFWQRHTAQPGCTRWRVQIFPVWPRTYDIEPVTFVPCDHRF